MRFLAPNLTVATGEAFVFGICSGKANSIAFSELFRYSLCHLPLENASCHEESDTPVNFTYQYFFQRRGALVKSASRKKDQPGIRITVVQGSGRGGCQPGIRII